MGELNTGTAGARLAIVLTTVIVTTAVLAGGVALSTVGLNSVGTAEIRDNSVQGVDIRNNTVASVDIANDSIRTSDIKDGAISGPDIRDGTVADVDLAPRLVRWALVDADNVGSAAVTVLAGRGVSSASRADKGEYVVTFNEHVRDCGMLATLNGLQYGGPAGEITVGPWVGNPRSVFVKTFNSAGAPVDPHDNDGFTVQVVC